MSAKKVIDRQELERLYASGLSIKDCARALGASHNTVRKAMAELGVQSRGTAKSDLGRARLSATKTIPLDEALLRDLASQGLSTAEIGESLGVSAETARDRMISLGIPRLDAKARPHKNVFWKGGRIVDADGYILVKSLGHPCRTKAGYVREHRLVMEAILGRFLSPAEVVHHKDGDTSNNTPSNLELFDSNGAHLASTLKGRVPRWTPDGVRRIREGVRAANNRRKPIHAG